MRVRMLKMKQQFSLAKLTHLKVELLVLLKRFCPRGIKLRWPLLKDLNVWECNDQVRILFEEIGLEGQVNTTAPLFFVDKVCTMSFLFCVKFRQVQAGKKKKLA